jgi:hypothetical protein
MPIVVNHGDPANLLNAAIQSRQRADQRIVDQRAFQTEMREDEQAFRAEQNARNRNQQFELQENAAQNRLAEMDQRAEVEKQKMIDSYKMKDAWQQKQIDKKRSIYLSQKDKIDSEYNNGNGKINYQQYVTAMDKLNSQFDPLVTSPFFKDLKKAAEEHPTMDINGESVRCAIDPKTGLPDYHKTRMDESKRVQDVKKAAEDAAEKKRKTVLEILKLKNQALSAKDLDGKPLPGVEDHIKELDKMLGKLQVDEGGLLIPGDSDPATMSIDGDMAPIEDMPIDTNIIGDPTQPHTVKLPPKPNAAVRQPEVRSLVEKARSGKTLSPAEVKQLKEYLAKKG